MGLGKKPASIYPARQMVLFLMLNGKKNYRRKMVFGKYLSYGYWPGRCPINSVAGGDDGGSGSDGELCAPRIALLTTNNQQLITNNCKGTGVSETNRNLILEGMVGACSPGGTAFPFFEWNQGLALADAKA